ncbi:MAG: HAD family phosphatase [Armatimonadetes bacterium]|nr:HAD family phosphatase [Armatimonadota bacterium]
MPPVRLIATDLDGTLLTSRRELNSEAAAALRQAHEAGIVVCLASGRALNTMLPYAEQLGVPGPIVSCNGAYVVDHRGIPIHDHSLEEVTRDVLLDYASHNGLHVNAYVKGRVLSSEAGEWYEMYRARVRAEMEVVGMAALADYRPTKILFIDEPEAILHHRSQLAEVMAPHGVTVVISEPDYIEFLPAGVTKAEGLKAVAAALEIAQDEVAAVGDWDNDLEMVQWAGLGGAVANGSEAVRAAADIVVSSNDEGGVAEFVRMACFGVSRSSGYTLADEV